MSKSEEQRPFRWWILLLQLLALCALVWFVFQLKQKSQPYPLELRYRIPGQEDIVEEFHTGDPVILSSPAEIEEYTFLGWADETGSFETRASFPIYRDTVYTARYAMAFQTERHIPYLTLDENQVLDVDAPVTIREYVQVLYKLLDTRLVGHGFFEDVAEDDACHTAAATLKALGVYPGMNLYPDDSLTRAELFRSLCCFYPRAEGNSVFADLDSTDDFYPVFQTAAARGWTDAGSEITADPDAIVSHGELARVMNRVLGRDKVRRLRATDVGMILDVPPTEEYYLDVAEAVIPHEHIFEGDEERWISSEALPVHEPGTFFAGVRLHCVLPNGEAAVDTTVSDMRFNRNGELTSGDAELDRMIWDLLPSIIDPNSMTQEEMLIAAYQYVVKNFTYSPGFVYPLGETDWTVPEAKRMLESGKGNSYSYAALFYELARFTGVTGIRPVSGMIYGKQESFLSDDGTRVEAADGYKPHGWVELKFMGSECFCDAELESRASGLVPMFRRNGTVRYEYGYRESQ